MSQAIGSKTLNGWFMVTLVYRKYDLFINVPAKCVNFC